MKLGTECRRQAWRAAAASQETNTTSVFASRNESKVSWRSRASSSHTAVNANGWKTRSTLCLPRNSESVTRGFRSR